MTKLTVEEVLDILKQEIEWCESNVAKPDSTSYQEGFICGLRQAQGIILAAEFNRVLMEKDYEQSTK